MNSFPKQSSPLGSANESSLGVLRREQVLSALRSRAAARRRKGKRGVALLMVLGTLTILTVMLTEFQSATSAELGSSISARDQVKAEYAARSAVNLTRLLIAAEPTVRAPLQLLVGGQQIPIWEYTDVILGAFNDVDGGAAFEGISGMNLADGRNLGMDGAAFELTVIDEDSKINLNLAARADAGSKKRMALQLLTMFSGQQYDKFFEDAEDEKGNRFDRQTVCASLIDWVDPDTDIGCDTSDVASASRPEDSYYQLLDKPYRRKNAAFDSLEEVRLVAGVDDKFWRTFFSPDPDDPRSRLVTVWGGGKVNVNSANPKTLLALVCYMAVEGTPLCQDPIMIQKYLMTFQMFAGAMAGIPIFRDGGDFVKAIQGKGSMFANVLQGVGVEPVRLKSAKQLEKAVTTSSKVFSIYATGVVRSGKRETRSKIHTVIDMRGAPPPGTASSLVKLGQVQNIMEEQLGDLAAAIETSKAGDGSELPQGFEEGGFAAALLPRPSGSVLYYRVD